jgi:hypothetical protein
MGCLLLLSDKVYLTIHPPKGYIDKYVARRRSMVLSMSYE